MKIFKKNDKYPASPISQKEQVSQKKHVLFFLILISMVGFLTGTFLIRNKWNQRSPFENRIFRALSLEELPFLEKRSFFFPPAADEPKSSAIPEEKQVIEETESMKASKNKDWWLNSGGIMYVNSDEFSTNLGALKEDSFWRKLYAKTNPKDTDDGYFPQNIFRLVTRRQWKNFSQSLYFKINKINMSESSNRNESNGVLLFNRYQDGKDLYYTGLRVDGDAVIKKKIGGKYQTLEEKKVFSGNGNFDRHRNPNLLPINSWIGIKSEVKNISGGWVTIKLYVDKEGKGDWQLILEKKDKPDEDSSRSLLENGYAGIRTDFLDVSFKDYDIQKL